MINPVKSFLTHGPQTTSVILHRTSIADVCHQMSDIRHMTSDVYHQTSDDIRQTSDIRHMT